MSALIWRISGCPHSWIIHFIFSWQGLDILGEESGRDVPALSSSVYGHRPPIEGMEKDYVRVGVVKRDFFRARGGVINTN